MASSARGSFGSMCISCFAFAAMSRRSSAKPRVTASPAPCERMLFDAELSNACEAWSAGGLASEGGTPLARADRHGRAREAPGAARREGSALRAARGCGRARRETRRRARVQREAGREVVLHSRARDVRLDSKMEVTRFGGVAACALAANAVGIDEAPSGGVR